MTEKENIWNDVEKTFSHVPHEHVLEIIGDMLLNCEEINEDGDVAGTGNVYVEIQYADMPSDDDAEVSVSIYRVQKDTKWLPKNHPFLEDCRERARVAIKETKELIDSL